ncbi:Crp/Fnr family transcriptional regulator [Clostridium ganghwense]|uniref:Crp/Fnr family transcriptional regulator n=1 Tax=Clostridium ganghwense TaxID=312089 RepID=A0ABT4CPY1_9CLOT|nr:Crp/Fnr family transcriptional regulator [Clostridium ganghwense]
MQDISLFSTLQEEELKEISNLIVTREYKKGETIFFQGDVSEKLYIVSKGKIKIFKHTKEGKEQILYILSNGGVIGALNLLKKDKFDFNAEALENTRVCTLNKEDFDNVIIKNPQITLKILEKVYDRVVNVENLVQRLSTKDVEAKVAGVLLSLIKDFGVETEKGIILDMSLNREEMGSYAGITRETISRKLAVMQEEGIIELIGNKKILIKDIETLKNIF